MFSLSAIYLDNLERVQTIFEVSTLGVIIYFMNYSLNRFKPLQLFIVAVLYILPMNFLWDSLYIDNVFVSLIINNLSIIPLLLYLVLLLKGENVLNRVVKAILLLNIAVTLSDNFLEVTFFIDIPKDSIIIIGYSCISIYYINFISKSLVEKNKSYIKPLFIEKFNITKREAEIVKFLCNGLSYRRISEEMNISLSTVKTHVHNIYKKTQVNSRFDLLNLLKEI